MTPDELLKFGLAPHEIGNGSPFAFVHALNFCQRKLPVFSCGADQSPDEFRHTATCNAEKVMKAHRENPDADWYFSAGRESGAFVLYIRSLNDLMTCEKEFGSGLPATWRVDGPAGDWYLFFRATRFDQDLIPAGCLGETGVALVDSAPLPGSRHAASGARYFWHDLRSPGTVILAALPRPYIRALIQISKPRAVAFRPEWRERCGRFKEVWQ